MLATVANVGVNGRRRWDLTSALRALGYMVANIKIRSTGNALAATVRAEAHFDRARARTLPGAGETASSVRAGGLNRRQQGRRLAHVESFGRTSSGGRPRTTHSSGRHNQVQHTFSCRYCSSRVAAFSCKIGHRPPEFLSIGRRSWNKAAISSALRN